MQDNAIVQVPHPLVHFPFFFVANTPAQGFFYAKPNAYGDMVSVQAPQTPRVREMLVFLAALTFLQAGDLQAQQQASRVKITISEKKWRRAAGFGRTKGDKKSFREAIEILSKIIYSVERNGAREKAEYADVVFDERAKPLPYSRCILPGVLGDVFFGEDGYITVHAMRDFVTDLDQRALRVSLTHILSLKGHIARTLAYIMYGRQAWAGTWGDLAELVRIEDWSQKYKIKQALTKALNELSNNGFAVDIGDKKILIKRTARLQKLIKDK